LSIGYVDIASISSSYSFKFVVKKMPKENGPEWNYVAVQTNDRPNI